MVERTASGSQSDRRVPQPASLSPRNQRNTRPWATAITILRQRRPGVLTSCMRTLLFLLTPLVGCAPGSGDDTLLGAVEVCGNTIDDDGDGASDCQDSDCASNCPELCANEIDDDADGALDCEDTDCDGSCVESCSDTRDNDGDGKIDCGDEDCNVVECPEDCIDGRDNDDDGASDCSDTDCVLASCDELCTDGRDNDADAAVDCDDSDCDGLCPEDCEDGRDNDIDGFVDCDDPECTGGCPEDCVDGFDNDADALVDCLDPECDAECDLDLDGFLNADHGGDDCDDNNPTVNPEANEVCDGVDNECDLLVDEADPDLDVTTMFKFFADNDADAFGNRMSPTDFVCTAPAGFIADDGDCDDENAAVNPGAVEICDGFDNDCDGLRDDADPSIDLTTALTWYPDADGDGFGAPGVGVFACTPPPNHVDNDDDCDDTTDDIVSPGDFWFDADGDGYGTGAGLGVLECESPTPGWVAMALGEDCNDDDGSIHPEGVEVCADGIDSDCDGVDGGCAPTYVGQFKINDGPPWTDDPLTKTCIGTCANLFGGIPSDYTCSTVPAVVNGQAYLDGWGDSTYCTTPKAEDWKLNWHYDCGVGKCSYSTFVTDHGCTSVMYCWLLP